MSWLRAYLVEDVHLAWRWSSVRFHGVVLLLASIFAIMPELDPAIAGVLPKPAQSVAFCIYAVVALLFRVTKLKSDAS